MSPVVVAAAVLRASACEYAYRGWAVLPLRPCGKAPYSRLVPRGLNEATSDLATVFRWWVAAPSANIGINCERSGLLVLDVDPRHGGDDSLANAQRLLGALPPTVEAHTGGEGVHLLFRDPGGEFRRELAPGIDIKRSGYIVAPPSVHPSGRRYEWSVDGHPADVPVAELPEAWLARCRRPVVKRRPPTGRTSNDDLLQVAAATYVERLTGRRADDQGWVRCPFHKGGAERTPSFQVEGTLWRCFGACEPLHVGRVLGGNIYTLAGLVWGYPLPLRGHDFTECRARLQALL